MSKVSLTVDNGPHAEVTPAVLEVLAQRMVTAWFFVIGEAVARPGGLALVEQIAAGGHDVGNHTWTHGVQFGLNPSETAVADEVARTAELLAPYAASPPLFRPAGGGGRLDATLFSSALIEHLCREGYTCALWNLVPRDWEDLDGWVDRALAELDRRNWNVVVVHDTLPGNAEQIAAFIDRARERGHEFVDDIAPQCLPIVAGRLVQDLGPFTGDRTEH